MDKTNSDFSVLTSRAMDRLGYSYRMVQERKRCAHFFEQYLSDADLSDADCRRIIAGSKGEGLTSWWESDFDVMFEPRHIACTDDVSKYRNDANMTVFAVEREHASPGYTCLRLVQLGHNDNDFLEYVDNDFYFPNTFPKCLEAAETDFYKIDHHVSGPAVNTKLYYVTLDSVFAIRCECPEIKQAFVSRQRKHDQPSQEDLDEVLKLDTHVVAVGNSRSDLSDLEWRICDTEAELYLMGKLNETQLQLYVLLKLLAKCVLKEMNDISSYVLKTVVLWMTELIHRDKFQKETLVQRLIHALKILRQCVRRCYLPNYMLPQRNMFSGKLKRRKKVIELLTHMINEGETVVLLCPRLKEAMLDMYVSPERTQHLGDVRDKIEVLLIHLKCKDDNVDRETLVAFVLWIRTNCWQDVIACWKNDIDLDTYKRRFFLKLGKLLT